MKKLLVTMVAMALLAGVLAGCGTTPEPTEPPPTQTPWIVVVTATPGPQEVAQVQPTQTPWIIVATPTRTAKATLTRSAAAGPTDTAATEEPTVEVVGTPEPMVPTDTPSPSDFKYPPPALLAPPNYRPVSWKNTVLLEWSSVGELAADEYYHLHLERRPEAAGQDWYGDYVYTKETEFLAEADFLAPFHPPTEYGQGIVYWWVWVVRKTGEDENGKPTGIDIGAYSEERTLLLQVKPEGD
jgi:hypothetical protein